MFKRINLRAKMLIMILSCVFAVFMLTIGFVTIKSRNMSVNNARHMAEEMTYRYSNEIKVDLELAMNVAGALASSFEGMAEAGISDRAAFDEMLRKVLADNPDRFIAVWSCWEPNALDGRDEEYRGKPGHDETGRYVPYWNKGSGSIEVTPLVGYDIPGEGDYYLIAKKTKRETLLEPYSYRLGDREILMTTTVVPILVEGKFLGAVGIDVELSHFEDLIRKVKPFGTGFAGLMANNGSIIADGKPEHEGHSLADYGVAHALEPIRRGEEYTTLDYSESLKTDVYRLFVPIHIGNTDVPWSFAVHVPKDTVLADANRMMYWTIAIGVIAMIVISLVVLMIANSISKPIRASAELLTRFSTLNLTFDESKTWLVKYLDHKDEIGGMLRAMMELQQKVSGFAKNVQAAMVITGQGAESLAALSEETNASMEEISAAVEQVAGLSESNSAALEESNASIQEVASGAQSVAGSAVQGAEAAVNTHKVVQTAVEQVNGMVGDINLVDSKAKESEENLTRLTGSVNEITDFVSIISGIADQTNLLALNAAIEAARAGDAGRGFAVVADEVRKLAEESNKAAQEVARLITTLQDNAKISMNVAKETGEIMQRTMGKASSAQRDLSGGLDETKKIEDVTQNIASVSQEQAASTEEMTRAIEQATDHTIKVVEMVKSINNSSDEATGASEGVAKEAQEMLKRTEHVLELLSQFKLDEEPTDTKLAGQV